MLLVVMLFWNGRLALLPWFYDSGSYMALCGKITQALPWTCGNRGLNGGAQESALNASDAGPCRALCDSRRAAFLRCSRNEAPPSHDGTLLHLRWAGHRLPDAGPAGRDGCGWLQAARFRPGRVPPVPSERWAGPGSVGPARTGCPGPWQVPGSGEAGVPQPACTLPARTAGLCCRLCCFSGELVCVCVHACKRKHQNVWGVF